jgi:beta-phosphoglucomutase-like phosphatase (HAD superfamily)
MERTELERINSNRYQIEKWEAQFEAEIEALQNIEEDHTEALEVAIEILSAWEERKTIKKSVARSSNSRKLTRLESKLNTLGYDLYKTDCSDAIEITKLN